MDRTNSWVTAQINQNAVWKTADMKVVSMFGSDTRPAGEPRTKPKKDMKFVVGQTKVGGKEVV